MITRAGVLRHRLLKSALDVSVPSADITAISKAASENSDIQRAVGTAWFLFLISTAVVWLTVFELNGTVRVVATLLFAITAPGWTVTAFLLPLEPAMEWSLTVDVHALGRLVGTSRNDAWSCVRGRRYTDPPYQRPI
jgi:hypothetical protein